jgi:hypothetical protein
VPALSGPACARAMTPTPPPSSARRPAHALRARVSVPPQVGVHKSSRGCHAFMRVHWVAMPKAMRARRVNRCWSAPTTPPTGWPRACARVMSGARWRRPRASGLGCAALFRLLRLPAHSRSGATQRRSVTVERRVWRAWLSADCLGQLLRTHAPALPPPPSTTTTLHPCGLSRSACTCCPRGHFLSRSPAQSACVHIRGRGPACRCPLAAGGRPVRSVRRLQGVGARARARRAGRFQLGSSANVD